MNCSVCVALSVFAFCFPPINSSYRISGHWMSVNVYTATRGELLTIRGIGDAHADKILELQHLQLGRPEIIRRVQLPKNLHRRLDWNLPDHKPEEGC